MSQSAVKAIITKSLSEFRKELDQIKLEVIKSSLGGEDIISDKKDNETRRSDSQ